MNYLLKSKPDNKNRKRIFLIVILFCLFSFVIYIFPNSTRSIFLTISKPIWVIRQSVVSTVSNVKNYFVSKSTFIDENIILKDEIARLQLKEIDYEILLKEFDDLKSQLGRKETTSRVISRILSRPPVSPYDTLVLDAGSSDGVALGDRVYISDEIIIGIIKNVTPHTSFVELFSNGDTEQEVTLSRTGASFVLKGLGGANLKLVVPKDTDIILGDTFLYPKFAPGIVGSVYYIDSSSQSSFKDIFVRVPTNISSIKYVFVEKSQ